MSGVERLLVRVAACGYRIVVINGVPNYQKTRADPFMPDGLLEDLKANKAAILAHFSENPLLSERELCSVCGREVDDEDKTVLATNHALCERGGPKGTRCPFKTL